MIDSGEQGRSKDVEAQQDYRRLIVFLLNQNFCAAYVHSLEFTHFHVKVDLIYFVCNRSKSLPVLFMGLRFLHVMKLTGIFYILK